jgi:hypothetical protein
MPREPSGPSKLSNLFLGEASDRRRDIKADGDSVFVYERLDNWIHDRPPRAAGVVFCSDGNPTTR